MKKYLIFVVIIFLSLLSACGNDYQKSAFYEVNKIEKTDYKSVLGSQYKTLDINTDFNQALLGFSYSTASELLENRNGMYSPVSFYIALSELAELTGSDTRSEVLNALKIEDIDVLRNGNQNLYKKLSYENKISTLHIANSIWLNKNEVYKDKPLEALRDKYYASSYGIDFYEDKKLIEEWVKDHTGDKLGSGDFDDLDSDVMFLLINTIYFYDEWNSKFNKDLNYKASFAGVNQEVEYMKQEVDGYYFKNEKYESSSLDFKNGMKISFVAPFDSNKFNEIINNEDLLKESLISQSKEKQVIDYRIPKFTYKSSFDLVEYSRTLGINKVFDIGDFTPLTDTSLFVSALYQKTFIEIDETGGKAAAYTAIIGEKSSTHDEEVIFNLNRPFIYAIYSQDYPIFIGVVTNPGSNVEEVYE